MSPPGRRSPARASPTRSGGGAAAGSLLLPPPLDLLPGVAPVRGSCKWVGYGSRARDSARSATRFLNDANGVGRSRAASTAARSDG
eukprot:6203030-Pleurochrysis_carterae.AAC.1